ncbi:glycerol dehydrogenase [Microbacterium oxydans]|uniref:glycerol dehydrogenase n=1 Tax=Microbacterium oxydans TaxID=82380 RepID=UPI00226B3DEA|nr:glycerol dehydrogenase [Microbacterium oxydans]WAA66074.1 glycerol dehydrogenase [Microbacterium oxydans]
MSRAYAGPGKYIQRRGEISRLSQHLAPLGTRALVLIDPFLLERLRDVISTDLTGAGIDARIEAFGGETTDAEIDRVTAIAREHGADTLVAVGGGKTADTVKIAAHAVGAWTVIVPTIASTDAPCSAVAVRYTPEGVWNGSDRLPRNPDLVVVDSEIVAGAPARFLVSGMGDALSTWFEARSNLESRTPNYVQGGFPPTLTAIALVKACHEALLTDGVKAKLAVEQGLHTLAVENVIEANMLLSSVGFENLGCSAAHAIHDGLTAIPEAHGVLHGEKVAFGTLCLLLLENRPFSELLEMIEFCEAVGLPTTLAELGITTNTREIAERIGEGAMAEGESAVACPVEVSVPIIRDAILALDAITAARKHA